MFRFRNNDRDVRCDALQALAIHPTSNYRRAGPESAIVSQDWVEIIK